MEVGCMNDHQQGMVSVIVPMYNGEKFIETCLNSILNQTYKNIEIIIIDDASTDCGAAICRRMAEKNPNIRVYLQPHGGVAAARNYGMTLARGEYIAFVDCDDAVEPPLYTKMVEAIERDGSDVVLDGRKFCDENYKVYHEEGYAAYPGRYEGEDINRLLLLPLLSRGKKFPFKQPLNNCSCCICLYKKDFLEGIRFVDESALPLAEDLIFQLYVLRKAKAVTKISGNHSLYFAPRGYVSRSKRSGEFMLGKRLSVMPLVEEFAAKNGDIAGLDEYIAARYVYEVSHCIFTDAALCKTAGEKLRLIRDYFNTPGFDKSVKLIYGNQDGFKFKTLMFMLRHRMIYTMWFYIAFVKRLKEIF